ncbi:polysaccharide deacetylase family protein [Asaia krungthepensis]|uniref:Chitooligosaccharide deacetylase n=1 Tax=Asaia krungthepensis NRIC 0535 TaxID=1307925 RepID=A0ABQ0Q4S6_9PROT|nr:polysaccharide deacetylase family protein [Asaia krungthepensis]GBQ91470.1 putative xylanase [Asaia krungthepensis NRIC 0535]
MAEFHPVSHMPATPMLSRRGLMMAGGVAAGAAFAASSTSASPARAADGEKAFWPGDARLAISLSLMYEGGGQPISGAGGVIPEAVAAGVPDLPTNAFFAYGHYEGIPRLLDLMDRHGIKLSAFMIGDAVKNAPDLAREIVRRGHEAAAHGRSWQNSYLLPPDQEKRFIASSVETIHRITGQQPVGWNAYWMRNSVHILETLQDLGFVYHIDEPSHDEPFIIPVRGRDFVTVPYTFHMNDIVSFPFQGWNPSAYEQALRDEFDQLYEEGATRRRMMVVSLHDRISGHAGRVRALDRFLTYARSKPGVWFARKDDIARHALATTGQTPVLQRGSPLETGLPGPLA